MGRICFSSGRGGRILGEWLRCLEQLVNGRLRHSTERPLVVEVLGLTDLTVGPRRDVLREAVPPLEQHVRREGPTGHVVDDGVTDGLQHRHSDGLELDAPAPRHDVAERDDDHAVQVVHLGGGVHGATLVPERELGEDVEATARIELLDHVRPVLEKRQLHASFTP